MADHTTTTTAGGASAAAAGLDIAKPRKQWQVVLRRFFRHKAAIVGMIVFGLLVLFAVLGPMLWKYDASELNLGRYQPPSADHPFGTGQIGDDLFAKVLSGTGFSMQIALVAAVINTAVGVVLGALAGYYRSWVDSAVSRLTDLVLVIPTFLVAAVLSRSTFSTAELEQGGGSSNWLQVAIILGLTNWMITARTVRGMVLSLREKEFVEAARALGGGPGRVIFKHILPNTMDVVIVNATISMAQAVLLESALSFVGLGVKYPDTSLGLLISENQNELLVHPWLFYFPFIFIVLISLSVNFIGDGLRDAFDPRQKRVRA
ncbi:ABC transporter permease [Kibdelosporangium persicum]|uniref:Binding-protein-dependent transport systems inner membrane component n=1 Tax=Kibdelosporangium persicum TaxID=2698649 RepID=A0ABX2F8R0_9PSEU|nr:ABC transporter permease [Kibdelosporangium persicum]NRN67734.1 Binding-protein-dependent transport systems inner membrane component [Kibdelosporangium persicum]